jgi:DNA-binding XRE family transcriptional regulator
VTGRRIPVDDTLRVRCWCGRADVAVPASEVKAGVTRSCGTEACTELADTAGARRQHADPRIVRRLAQTVEVLDQLGAVVRDERRRRGVSQAAAAAQIGIASHTLIAIETGRAINVKTGRGKRGPTVRVVVQVLAWLIDRDHRAGL